MRRRIFLVFFVLGIFLSEIESKRTGEDIGDESAVNPYPLDFGIFNPILGEAGDWFFSLFGVSAPGWLSTAYLIVGLCHIIIWPFSCCVFCLFVRVCGKNDDDDDDLDAKQEAIAMCICCLIWMGCFVCFLCIAGPFVFEFWPIVDLALLSIYLCLCLCSCFCALLDGVTLRDIIRPRFYSSDRSRPRNTTIFVIADNPVATTTTAIQPVSPSPSSGSTGGGSQSQLTVATAAMLIFVHISHIETKDRCAIGIFGSEYKLKSYYTSQVNRISEVLIDIVRQGTSGSTRLFQSMLDFAMYLHMNRRGSGTPTIMIVVTDGDDTTDMTPTECADALLETFGNQDGLNICILLGVGNGVNHSLLENMMRRARGLYIKVDDFGKLQLAFTFISAKVLECVKLGRLDLETSNFQLTAVSVQKESHVIRGPMDYGIILDISGSMDAKVDL